MDTTENQDDDALFEAMMKTIVGDDDIIPDDETENKTFEEEDDDKDDEKKPLTSMFGYNIGVNPDGSIKYPENPLKKDTIHSGLSHVTRTLDTLEFAYSRYDGTNKKLTNIDILREYKHLRIVNLSGNLLKSFKPLESMRYLLVLVANDNLLTTLEGIPELPFLQALSVKGNAIENVGGLHENILTYLQISSRALLTDNKIQTLDQFTSKLFPCLSVLELRANNITTLVGLNIPTLSRLFVAENELTDLDGLESCVNLTNLHARDNKISVLENFPKLEKLEYVNLRHNHLKRYTQTQHLGNARNIRTLIMQENPIATLPDYKLEMIATNQNLKRLDKYPITEAELIQGRQLRNGRERGLASGPVDDETLLRPEFEGEHADYETLGEMEVPLVISAGGQMPAAKTDEAV